MAQQKKQMKVGHAEEILAAEKRIQERKEYVAMLHSRTLAQAAHTIANLTNNQTDALHVLQGMKEELLGGGKGRKDSTELMLMANAFTLDALFSNMVCRIGQAFEPECALAYMDIGLRAQDQLRKVALALDQIRRPKQQILQTNIAGVQQVNNNLVHPSVDISNPQNKLEDSKIGGLIHEARAEALDGRATGASIQADTREADLVPLHRSSDA